MAGSKYNVINWIENHVNSNHFRQKTMKNELNTSEIKQCGLTGFTATLDHVVICMN